MPNFVEICPSPLTWPLAYTTACTTVQAVIFLVLQRCCLLIIRFAVDFLRMLTVITARSEIWKVLFLAPSVCVFLFVYEISPELLNDFAPDSRGRRVLSLAWTRLKVKVKGQGHKGQKRHFFRPFWWPVCGLCLVKHL